MNERRKQTRRLLTYFSRVIDCDSRQLLGYLVDMTTDGIMIIGNFPLRANALFRLRIDLPENYSDKNQIEFKAKVVWNQPDPDPELHRTGFVFQDKTADDIALLEDLITKYGADKNP
jgi:hypothetical protein